MQLCHTAGATSAAFDDPNLVSSAGLVPVVASARSAGLQVLADQHLSGADGQGSGTAGLKVHIAGRGDGRWRGQHRVAWALLRHGGMGRVFRQRLLAPSTLGSFLRSFSFGHVRQLDAVASRFLTRLVARASLIVFPAPG